MDERESKSIMVQLIKEEKRKTFTYDMGVYVQENKAITSVKRAKEFYTTVESILKRTKKIIP